MPPRLARGWAHLLVAVLGAGTAGAATTVPTDVQMPGTQPNEVSNIEQVSKCDNCHGNFDPDGEPWFNWSGSMMSHASRDPIFWATLAIAEQDFDGSGDLCLRCHVPEGWLQGRSVPTDGSALQESDADGVQCDVCHRLTNPDGSEHPGAQSEPFVANDGGDPPTGYYGSGQYVVYDGNDKLGPYSDADARHQFLQSQFHRSELICGTCHDVSNPVTGDLAPNHGAQVPLSSGFSGVPGSPVDGKAAFNHFPYEYGVVERTTSEHQASALSTTRVSDYASLPLELQDGSLQKAWQAAQLAGTGGDYEDGSPRYFSCQTCHMRPTIGEGCNKNPPVRSDLPVHDLTGGNYWVPDAIQYLDAQGQLVLGGGLTAEQNAALDAGQVRARQNLEDAASLDLNGNVLRVVNLTGHKLITGYPEGRRMWLNVRWFDSADQPLAQYEDAPYGTLQADVDGTPTPVDTLLDLDPPYTPVYEAHHAITQEWAAELLALGLPASLPLVYDRGTGAVTKTLGELAAQAPGTHAETFHFVLNNEVVKDNRIPPYGMDFLASYLRNIRPLPFDRYGTPGFGEAYDHWDEVALNPPPGADHAIVTLYYQPTSWEYIQFLHLGNDGSNAFLGQEGDRILDAWLNTGMAAPHAMASTTWQNTLAACADGVDNDGDHAADYPNDPGCTSAVDESENEPSLPCDDRLDGDGDGLVDFPRDPGCQGSASDREDPACDNGVDDDGDGLVDADDPACTQSWRDLEDPQCDDDVDNDGDGAIDWDGGAGGASPDPQCPTPDDDREARNRSGGCGLGGELVVLLPLLWGLARARRRRGA